jgi:hypothetical protein
MILSRNIHGEKIILFFSLLGNSILNLVHLSGLRRMMFQSCVRAFYQKWRSYGLSDNFSCKQLPHVICPLMDRLLLAGAFAGSSHPDTKERG